MGGFPFDDRFGVPGLVCAQNITADKETGKGGWSDGDQPAAAVAAKP